MPKQKLVPESQKKDTRGRPRKGTDPLNPILNGTKLRDCYIAPKLLKLHMNLTPSDVSIHKSFCRMYKSKAELQYIFHHSTKSTFILSGPNRLTCMHFETMTPGLYAYNSKMFFIKPQKISAEDYDSYPSVSLINQYITSINEENITYYKITDPTMDDFDSFAAKNKIMIDHCGYDEFFKFLFSLKSPTISECYIGATKNLTVNELVMYFKVNEYNVILTFKDQTNQNVFKTDMANIILPIWY